MPPETDALLESVFGASVRIERRPHEFATSFPLVKICVCGIDGSALSVLAKDLRWEALPRDMQRVKPAFLHDPAREIEVYRRILEPEQLGTARFHGAAGGLLLIELVDGVELWQVGELDVWCHVAEWLGRMHRRLAVRTTEPHLLVYDAEFFRLWLDRARAFRGSLGTVEACYEQAVDRLAELPRTVIHGELYPSNVIVADGRICPVDWELAGVGPGLLDLAALTTGWGERERSAIVEAYGTVSAFDLDCCRLHLAIRWLGWCEEWSPPRGHAHDWLAEAAAVSERLRSMY